MTKLYPMLETPLAGRARLVLFVLLVPLALTLVWPLWRIDLLAPQYPYGLWLDIYAWKLQGGNEGQHLNEINTLNHYIGMHKIDRASLADLDWLPFAFGILALLALRVVAMGRVRDLVDLTVLSMYFAAFSAGRFVYKMWHYGHDLDPAAPLDIQPFMPAIFGTKQVGNFATKAMPQMGTYMFAIFLGGLVLVLAWQLWRSRRQVSRPAYWREDVTSHGGAGVPA